MMTRRKLEKARREYEDFIAHTEERGLKILTMEELKRLTGGTDEGGENDGADEDDSPVDSAGNTNEGTDGSSFSETLEDTKDTDAEEEDGHSLWDDFVDAVTGFVDTVVDVATDIVDWVEDLFSGDGKGGAEPEREPSDGNESEYLIVGGKDNATQDGMPQAVENSGQRCTDDDWKDDIDMVAREYNEARGTNLVFSGSTRENSGHGDTDEYADTISHIVQDYNVVHGTNYTYQEIIGNIENDENNMIEMIFGSFDNSDADGAEDDSGLDDESASDWHESGVADDDSGSAGDIPVDEPDENEVFIETVLGKYNRRYGKHLSMTNEEFLTEILTNEDFAKKMNPIIKEQAQQTLLSNIIVAALNGKDAVISDKYTVTEQLTFLENYVHMAKSFTSNKALANAATVLRQGMRNSHLFNYDALLRGYDGDEVFMNETLRDFLNTSDDGEPYKYKDMTRENGWTEKKFPGNLEHQTDHAWFRLNKKFVCEDGREAVFTYKDGNWVLSDNERDKGTYNYALDMGEFGVDTEHGRWDMNPYFRQFEITPWYREGSGVPGMGTYGFNTKLHLGGL